MRKSFGDEETNGPEFSGHPVESFPRCCSLKESCVKSVLSFFRFDSLPKGIFAVSLFGLFLGASTTIVYSQLALFLKNELHASEAKIAFLDGFVEFISFVVRVFSGIIIDYFRNRKIVLLVGCVLTLFMKPLFAISKSALLVLFAQSVERIGNGLQAVPRDALIADLSNVDNRGRSFGFSRSLKTTGSLLGTCIAIAIMWLTDNNYRIVFFCATVPVVIAIMCLSKIKEQNRTRKISTSEGHKIENPFKKKYLKSLDASFWKLIALACIFELGHFSETMLPIYASNFLSVTVAGSASMFLSLGQVILSYPIGLYADRFSKRTFIKVCISIMIASNLFLITATSIVGVYMGAFLWGGQMSAIQGLFLSLISERVDPHLRGTAIGIYYCVIGSSFLTASVIGGNIWTSYGCYHAFAYSIAICCVSLLLFNILLPQKSKSICNN